MKYFAIGVLMLSISCMGQEGKLTGRDARIFEDTPLWDVAQAIRDNDIGRAKRLLEGKPKSLIDYKEKYFGQSLLNWAVYRGNYEVAKILLELGADPNLKANDSTTAVINAADKDTSEYLKLVLQYKGDVNVIADIDEPQIIRTPLIAASARSLESVKLLIEAGADPNYVHRMDEGILSESIQSALVSACEVGRIDIVNYLLIDVGVKFDYHFYTTIENKQLGILYELRQMIFPLDSREYQTKMEVVKFLKTKGLDYWSEPIPELYKKQYDRSYLEKY
jgi:uncharacterized protein